MGNTHRVSSQELRNQLVDFQERYVLPDTCSRSKAKLFHSQFQISLVLKGPSWRMTDRQRSAIHELDVLRARFKPAFWSEMIGVNAIYGPIAPDSSSILTGSME